MADAVVDPGAVMVHLEDTKAALLTVMCAHWLPCLLPWALVTVFVLEVLALERWSQALLNATRVRAGNSQERNVCQRAEAIKCDEVEEAGHIQGHPRHELLVNRYLSVPIEYIRHVTNVRAVHDEKKCLSRQYINLSLDFEVDLRCGLKLFHHSLSCDTFLISRVFQTF